LRPLAFAWPRGFSIETGPEANAAAATGKSLRDSGLGNDVDGVYFHLSKTSPWLRRVAKVPLALLAVFALCTASSANPQGAKQPWKTVPFAIVRYNDDAPKSWNVYHSDRKGLYLVRLWKRYLLIDTDSQNVFEIDPSKVVVKGDGAVLASEDIPAEPIEISEWKTRNTGPVLRHRFRFGTSGNFLELQIPLQMNGKPAY
jgi:hypothetical protein